MGPEWIVVLVVALLVFGGSQIPKLARSLGQATSEFKKGTAEGDHKADAKNEPVTMTRAELDALIAEREAAARREVPPSS
jgi:sec-independent protein translocase protein TatA